MTEEEKELFASLLSDTLSLKADVVILKEILIHHFKEFQKDKGNVFNDSVFLEGYKRNHKAVFEDLLVQHPILDPVFLHLIRNIFPPDNQG